MKASIAIPADAQELVQSAANEQATSSGASNSKVVEFIHRAGAWFYVLGYQFRFPNGAEDNLVRIFDAYANRDIVTGDTHFSVIGFDTAGDFPARWHTLIRPAPMVSGQGWDLYMTDKNATVIAAEALCLSLWGFQSSVPPEKLLGANWKTQAR